MDAIDMIAGVVGGMVVVLVGHPFDTVKIRLQTAPLLFYKSSIDCVQKTMQWEGVKGFYTGILSPLSGQMFFRACYFTTYFAMRRMLKNNNHPHSGSTQKHQNLTTREFAMCGAVTGFTISFIEAPIDLMKTKLQIQIFQAKLNPSHIIPYRTVYQCALYHIREYGTRSLWQGFTATLIRNIPGNAALFATNETLKRALYAADSNKEFDVRKNLLSGAAAGLSYWVGIYPLDVIKSKMQSLQNCKNVTWISTVRTMIETGGIKTFGQGFLPCILRAMPACSLMLTTVDIVRAFLQKKGF